MHEKYSFTKFQKSREFLECRVSSLAQLGVTCDKTPKVYTSVINFCNKNKSQNLMISDPIMQLLNVIMCNYTYVPQECHLLLYCSATKSQHKWQNHIFLPDILYRKI